MTLRKIALAAVTASGFWSGTAAADTWVKLVCQNSDRNYIIYFGPTIRLTLDMTQRLAWDDKGGRSNFDETDARLSWTRNGTILGSPYSWEFDLDRATLALAVSTWSTGSYQCQKDAPQL